MLLQIDDFLAKITVMELLGRYKLYNPMHDTLFDGCDTNFGYRLESYDNCVADVRVCKFTDNSVRGFTDLPVDSFER